MKTRLEIMIVIVVISVIASTFAITNVYDSMRCDEHGGKWMGIIGYGGCAMDNKECKEAGGIVTGCLSNSPGLSCIAECHFED